MSDMYDPLDVEGTERSRAAQLQRERQALEAERDDLKWLMGSKRGRRIVHRLLQHSGMHNLSFTTNAMQTAFNEGNRNQGQRLQAMLEAACSDLYLQMLQEHLNGHRNADDGRRKHN